MCKPAVHLRIFHRPEPLIFISTSCDEDNRKVIETNASIAFLKPLGTPWLNSFSSMMTSGETTARSGLGRRWNPFPCFKVTTESQGQGKASSLECLDRRFSPCQSYLQSVRHLQIWSQQKLRNQRCNTSKQQITTVNSCGRKWRKA